jgi:hypothetical protein
VAGLPANQRQTLLELSAKKSDVSGGAFKWIFNGSLISV